MSNAINSTTSSILAFLPKYIRAALMFRFSPVVVTSSNAASDVLDLPECKGSLTLSKSKAIFVLSASVATDLILLDCASKKFLPTSFPSFVMPKSGTFRSPVGGSPFLSSFLL